MMPCERKSVEPLAAVTAPARVAAQHQSLLHFIGAGGWSDEPSATGTATVWLIEGVWRALDDRRNAP